MRGQSLQSIIRTIESRSGSKGRFNQQLEATLCNHLHRVSKE